MYLAPGHVGIDFDTGNETEPGEYDLADKNYIVLLLTLKKNNFKKVNVALKQNIGTLAYDSDDNRTSIMFQIWKGQKILNPEEWLYK